MMEQRVPKDTAKAVIEIVCYGKNCSIELTVFQ